MPGHRRPALVVDAAVAEHLEVLRLVPLGRLRVVEGVEHAEAFDRRLLDAVDDRRMRQPGGLEDRRGDVDDVMELAADLALGLDAVGPVHDRAVAGAAPVRRHLLGPLVGRVHRVGPAHRVVVVGVGPAEVVDLRRQELGGLEAGQAVEHRHLVEAAVGRAFGRGAVVADDQVDQRVVEHFQILERVDQPPEVMVGVLEEPGVDLHLAREDRPHVLGRLVPGGNLGRARRQLGIRGDHAQLLLAREGFLAQLVPALVELALVLVGPFLGHVVRGVAGARREIHEERLVGHQRLLLARPLDRLAGHVVGEVIALLGRLLRFDGRGALVDRRVPLVGLAADETRRSTRSRRRRSATGRTGRAGWSPTPAPRGTCRTGRSSSR